jgi:hypothetical protein|tara:strand:- start:500 stop:958 length:459 start_codon:yes stop_codon:yes gene_type:complete
MFKKILACFISALIVLLPFEANANELEGRVTSISLGEEAPYAGILLDSIAASKMVIDKKYLKFEIELQLRKEFQQDLANKRLAFDLLKVEYDSLNKIHESTISLRDQQINDLNILLKEEMGDDHTAWWVIGGVALGIVLSVVTFYASIEVAK